MKHEDYCATKMESGMRWCLTETVLTVITEVISHSEAVRTHP